MEVTFRYYVFISDSKVDMLLPQIDPGRSRAGKRTTELKVNLSVLSAKVTSDSSGGGDRIARLERVVRYLADFGDLGTVDEPGQFFAGIMPMRWGPFLETSLVYFAGEQDDVVVGLGGSGKHVLGAPAESEKGSPGGSNTPWLLKGLAADPEISELLGVGQDSDDNVLRAVTFAGAEMPGPEQNVEFIAKRLLHGRVDGKSVILGSPLYAAVAD